MQLFEVVNDELISRAHWNPGGLINDRAASAVFSPDNSLICVCGLTQGLVDNVFLLSFDEETYDFSVVASIAIVNSTEHSCWTSDGSRIVIAHNRRASDSEQISLLSWDGTDLTRLDGISVAPGATSGGDATAVDIFEDRWVAVGRQTTNGLVVLDMHGDELTLVGSIGLPQVALIGSTRWSPDGQFIAVGSFNQLTVFQWNGSSLTQVANVSTSNGRGVTWVSSTLILKGPDLFSFDGSSLTLVSEVINTGASSACDPARNRIAVSRQSTTSTLRAQLYALEGTATALLSSVAADVGLENGFYVSNAQPVLPPTPEDTFRSIFAEASGRDPQATALTRGSDVQRLINHNIALWAGRPGEWQGVPRLYSVPVELRYGERHQIGVGKVVFLKEDHPGLRQGRYVRILSAEGGARPGTVSLTCMGWDDDEQQ